MRLANLVKETTTSIAGTSGNGAVTLTAISGFPRFSTYYGSGPVVVPYTIYDESNAKFETGIGSLSSNVLTRTLPQVTWDGSTLDESSPSPLQFGSTPTSGNVIISITPTAERMAPFMVAKQSVISGDSWSDYPVLGGCGVHYGTGYSAPITADREYYQYTKILHAGLLVGAQLQVSSAVASSNLKWRFYDIGPDGLPLNKLLDFTTISTASTGIKTDTAFTPIKVTPGFYVTGIITNDAIGLQMINGTNASIVESPLGRKDGYGKSIAFYQSGSYSIGLPNPFSASSPTMINMATGAFQLGHRVTP